MDKCCVHGMEGTAHACPSVTVSDNYERLQNKPAVNGVVLSGNKSAAELSLLPDKPQAYPDLKLGAEERAAYVVLLTPDGGKGKVPLGDIMRGHFVTGDEVPKDLDIGNYCFVKKEE